MKPNDDGYTAKKKYSPPSLEEIRRLYAELGLAPVERFRMVTVTPAKGFAKGYVTVHLSDAGMVAEVIGAGLAPEFHARPKSEQ